MKGTRIFVLIALFLFLSIQATPALAQWEFGIGTGFTMLSVDGDIGIESNLAGPVKLPVDLDAGDVSDLMQTAFGFGGYATDGTWMVRYSFGMLELEGKGKDGNIRVDVDYKTTGGELTVGHPVYKSSPLSFSLLGGLRYTKQELTSRVSDEFITLKTDNDNDWIDAVIGATVDVELSQNWSWNTRADVGFGGSEGTYTGSTGVTWRFLENWSGTLSAKYASVEFENGSKGDSDWYLYDVDETYLGLTILYNW